MPGILPALDGVPQGLDLQLPLPPQQTQGVGVQALRSQPAKPASRLFDQGLPSG